MRPKAARKMPEGTRADSRNVTGKPTDVCPDKSRIRENRRSFPGKSPGKAREVVPGRPREGARGKSREESRGGSRERSRDRPVTGISRYGNSHVVPPCNITDDWPEDIPITKGELDLLERNFSDIITAMIEN